MKTGWRHEGGWVRLAEWEKRFGVVAVVSSCSLGDMKDVPNFEKRLGEIGLDSTRWVGGQQVHGRRVVPVERLGSKEKARTDGVMTRSVGLTLRVFTADCVPVFLVDPVRWAIGLVHAGWRGVRKGIVETAIQSLGRTYHSRPEDVHVAFGPHIGACCYEVGPEVARLFQETTGAVSRGKRGADDRQRLNLSAVLRTRVQGMGVRGARITSAPGCTVCDPRFFSYRRERTEHRQAALLCLGKRSHENRQTVG